MSKIKEIYHNKWVRFAVMSILWVLIFTIWSRMWYTIFFVPFIYDHYITRYANKYAWSKCKAFISKYRALKWIMGWVDAILFATIAVTILKLYFISQYVIPTPSMEKTLLVGDYLWVDKYSYGPVMPNTPLAIPFVHNINPLNPEKKSYVEWIKFPYKRLAGTTTVKVRDVIVFNYPQGDTVLVKNPQNNYYTDKRNNMIPKGSKIMVHPVDKRDNYIKRAVAIAGDTLTLKRGDVYINGVKEPEMETRQDLYLIQFNPNAINAMMLNKIGITKSSIIPTYSQTHMLVHLTEEENNRISRISGVQNSVRHLSTEPNIDVFPYDTLRYKFNHHDFGPVIIPQKGVTVNIDVDNLPLYERIITTYEGNKLEVKENNDIYINGEKTDKYQFQMDYYFGMGDNRDNSLDSRFFGFIPEDHLVGKARFVMLSTDKTKSFLGGLRFDRFFKGIE